MGRRVRAPCRPALRHSAWGRPVFRKRWQFRVRGALFRCGVHSLYEDAGYLWVGAMTGLWQWKPGPPKRYQTSATDLHAITRGDRGTPLIAVHDRLEQLVDGRLVPYSIPGDAREFNPTHFLRDRNGGLWIGTQTMGCSLCNREGRIVFHDRMVSRVMTLPPSMKIAREVYGSQPARDLIASGTLRSLPFPRRLAPRRSTPEQFWRRRTEVSG